MRNPPAGLLGGARQSAATYSENQVIPRTTGRAKTSERGTVDPFRLARRREIGYTLGMSFELKPVNREVATLTINQSAWLPIWRWLCAKYNDSWDLAPFALREEFVRAGQFNRGLDVDAAMARRFAVIISNHGDDPAYPSELREAGRTQQLVKFFRECDGFQIHETKLDDMSPTLSHEEWAQVYAFVIDVGSRFGNKMSKVLYAEYIKAAEIMESKRLRYPENLAAGENS